VVPSTRGHLQGPQTLAYRSQKCLQGDTGLETSAQKELGHVLSSQQAPASSQEAHCNWRYQKNRIKGSISNISILESIGLTASSQASVLVNIILAAT